MRRRSWHGAIQVTVMTVAVMLAWTAWVFHVVALPDAPRGQISVFETIEDRGCHKSVRQDV
jgi:hypothetical protein